MRWLSFAAFAVLALGCGPSVETASTTSGVGGTTSASTGGTGGGVTTTTTTTTITVSTSSTTTVPPPACDPASTYFDYAIEGGPSSHYGADFAPIGYFVWPGGASPPGPPPPPSAMLVVLPCSVCDWAQISISGVATTWGPGVTASASIDDYEGSVHYQSLPGTATLTLTTLSDVGGALEGTFTGMLQPVGTKPPAVQVSGKFRVCRQPDQIPV